MRVWSSNDFSGQWPVPTAAVVTAETEDEARRLLDEELRQAGLPKGFNGSLVEIQTDRAAVVVLSDGEY